DIAPAIMNRDDMARSSRRSPTQIQRADGASGCVTKSSDRFAFALQYGVLHHVGHALPAGTVKSGDDVDAYDLHQPVFQLQSIDSPIANIGDGGDATGVRIARIDVHRLHRLFGPGARASQTGELLRLLGRVADHADTDPCIAVGRWLNLLIRRSGAAHKHS